MVPGVFHGSLGWSSTQGIPGQEENGIACDVVVIFHFVKTQQYTYNLLVAALNQAKGLRTDENTAPDLLYSNSRLPLGQYDFEAVIAHHHLRTASVGAQYSTAQQKCRC